MKLVEAKVIVPGMTWDQISSARKIETMMRDRPQLNLPVQHILHAGMYTRTVRIPARVMITGAHVKIPTVLIVSGNCGIWLGKEFLHIHDYKVFAAAAHRKQIFIAKTTTDITMCFPTQAKTVKEAEEQFTDEAHLLQNREV